MIRNENWMGISIKRQMTKSNPMDTGKEYFHAVLRSFPFWAPEQMQHILWGYVSSKVLPWKGPGMISIGPECKCSNTVLCGRSLKSTYVGSDALGVKSHFQDHLLPRLGFAHQDTDPHGAASTTGQALTWVVGMQKQSLNGL